jgi:hypothetical protein
VDGLIRGKKTRILSLTRISVWPDASAAVQESRHVPHRHRLVDRRLPFRPFVRRRRLGRLVATAEHELGDRAELRRPDLGDRHRGGRRRRGPRLDRSDRRERLRLLQLRAGGHRRRGAAPLRMDADRTGRGHRRDPRRRWGSEPPAQRCRSGHHRPDAAAAVRGPRQVLPLAAASRRRDRKLGLVDLEPQCPERKRRASPRPDARSRRAVGSDHRHLRPPERRRELPRLGHRRKPAASRQRSVRHVDRVAVAESGGHRPRDPPRRRRARARRRLGGRRVHRRGAGLVPDLHARRAFRRRRMDHRSFAESDRMPDVHLRHVRRGRGERTGRDLGRGRQARAGPGRIPRHARLRRPLRHHERQRLVDGAEHAAHGRRIRREHPRHRDRR